ncbi:tetratricopeptide TPR_2 repeat protein [Segniliparus rotundus DSM 44985]|uniref:Tetratricopeptide TPR_2 repeat protein n=1 Tax=Segniliparus rotundus (strain ATCC BAA-972 / CDC 1076 / CIP 108378 / DSM 44985 / JCM 13578) TaxID=640132 RepID=D6ZA84_SEGRD|nr:DUF5134 domain-containing protein [Segniliparus rotundus]ADG96626.1 tetratricopeptide TPR_2 repeat protein [Segniliparus rotundus DSM 44985]
MIADPWLRLALAALFGFSAGYCAWRLLRAGAFRPRLWRGCVGHVFHLLMCLSMLAMIWPTTPAVPYSAQTAVFAVATLWFAALALGRSSQRAGRTGFACASGRGAAWYHTTMMAAMLWMAAVMSGQLLGGAPPASAAPRPGGMAGMDMPGMSMQAEADGGARHTAPMWMSAVDVLLGFMFLAAALWWVRGYFELRRSRGRSVPAEAEMLCEVAMALGMGAMLFAMV